MHEVNFLSATGFCELSAETRSGYYIVRYMPDGTIIYLRNMKVVESLPKTPATKALLQADGKVRSVIFNYQNVQDAEQKKRDFWRIKELLREVQ